MARAPEEDPALVATARVAGAGAGARADDAALQAAAEPPLRVFWQPGCTSCLRTKEFLQERGVPFESLDVLASEAAMQELRRLGARSVPVVARGERWVHAQDLADVARIAGIELRRERLPVPVLLQRLDALLGYAATLVARLPDARLGEHVPSRPRSYADLAYHVGMIVDGFLEAADPARDGELSYAHFERLAPAGERSAAALARGLEAARGRLATWRACDAASPGRRLRTYYGERELHEVVERTAWHVAQHARQLEHIATRLLKVPGAPPLGAALLAGLPLPREVWDPEIRFG